MPYILQALGHLCEAFGSQGLDVFTQGTLPIPQSQERARILESKPCGLRRANETDNLQGILGTKAVIIVGSSCWRKQPHALVIFVMWGQELQQPALTGQCCNACTP
jgi:hypothetical protein